MPGPEGMLPFVDDVLGNKGRDGGTASRTPFVHLAELINLPSGASVNSATVERRIRVLTYLARRCSAFPIHMPLPEGSAASEWRISLVFRSRSAIVAFYWQ